MAKLNENLEIGDTLNKLKDIPFKDVYSTNEIKTNKVWIDNKPIYRKCFSGTTSNTTNNFFTIDNLDKIISQGGYVYFRSQYQFPIPSNFGTTGGNDIRIIKQPDGRLNMQLGGSDLYNQSFQLWIEYTKTN